MGAMASQITSLTIVYLSVEIKENIKAPCHRPLWGGIHRSPVNSPHKGSVTRKCFHLMTSSLRTIAAIPPKYMSVMDWLSQCYPWQQGSWGQHGAHLGPVIPRWAPCRPHEPCYLGRIISFSKHDKAQQKAELWAKIYCSDLLQINKTVSLIHFVYMTSRMTCMTCIFVSLTSYTCMCVSIHHATAGPRLNIRKDVFS